MVVGACVVKIQLGGVQGTVVVAPDIIMVIMVIIDIIVMVPQHIPTSQNPTMVGF